MTFRSPLELITLFLDFDLCLAGLAEEYPKALDGSVAVLTPYKAQLGLLRSVVASTLSKRSLKHIEFATVDGFQVHSGSARFSQIRLAVMSDIIQTNRSVNDLQTILAKL